MYLTVQQAARRLGVSAVTIRRWTASGFLPCARTAGGHRRIDERDLDDVAKAMGGNNQLAAQAAREREVDVLVSTSIAVAGKLDLTELLQEIAMRMTSVLDCHFCAISELDEASSAVRTLAEYDHAGRRLPDASPYKLSEYPLTRKVLDEQTPAVVNVDDANADLAEVAALRREGDRSLLMVPLIYRGSTIGLLEIVDQKRSRTFSRQELRLAGAIAGQAAVAIHNAKLFAERRRSEEHISALRRALTVLTRRLADAEAGPDAGAEQLLALASAAVCEATGAISCVAQSGEASAGAFGPVPVIAGEARSAERGASLLVVRDPSNRTDFTLTITLVEPPGDGLTELLDLVAAVIARALSRPRS
jgi:excisionase family DNA binding protein